MALVKVLVIDDDEDDYILTRDILNQIPHKENYTLTWINNYEEGINAMLKKKFDVYLVDYMLGKHTGIELLNEAIKSNVDEPIIMLTGQGDRKIDHQALEIGAADYLIKGQITPFTLERSLRYSLKHKQTLKALKESERKFKIIFDKSRDPFLIIGDTGEIKDVNYAGTKFLNYRTEELKQLTFDKLCCKSKDYERFIQRMNEDGAVNDLELKLRTQNNEIKTVTVSAFLQIEQHGTEELYYCILHDITGRKQEEKFVADAEKIIAIEKVTQNIADEIKNPLSNINLAIEQISSEIASEDELNQLYLDIIRSNFNKINHLISRLVNTASGKDINVERVNLDRFIEEFLSVEESKYEGLRIFKEIDEDMVLDIDAEQMSYVLDSMIMNAVQAGANTITLRTFKEKEYAAIEISDNGHGITEEDQQRIFDPFFTSRNKNFGVGLTNSRKIIHNHKGKLRMKSTWGTGTAFTIFLPLSAVNNLV